MWIGGGIHPRGNKKCMPIRAECEAETVVDQSYRDTLLAINRERLGSADSRSIKICLCRYIRNASGFKRSGTYFLVLVVLN